MNMQVSSNIIPNPEELGLTTASTSHDLYLERLLNQYKAVNLQVIDPEIAALLEALRSQSSAWVKKLTIPTKRDEEWRFTDLSPLLKIDFQPEINTDLTTKISDFTLPEAPIRLVFINGIYAPNLSSVTELPAGLIVSNLAQLPITQRSKIAHYLAAKEGITDVFTALNTASLIDSAVVWLTKNTEIETPIHLLFLTDASKKNIITQPRCLVVAESGSSVTIIEEYVSSSEQTVYFSNTVTQIFLEQNAAVNHNRKIGRAHV